MKILFTFENRLPSNEADAEVFLATARHLATFAARSWLHVPTSKDACGLAAVPAGVSVVSARAPARLGAIRHFCCGLTVVVRRAFREADLVYTRNLWVASMALLFGQRVVFDHYRPWPDQIPPLQPFLRALLGHPRFLVNICHSDYTRGKYAELGISAKKLVCIRNGHEPERLRPPLSVDIAKASIGVDASRATVVYTGRVNHKKGLGLLIEAALRLPDVLFILVGSAGGGPIEAKAASVPNVWLVGWQPPERLAHYLFAADVLVIPPSTEPLAEFGSTVLPLKLFLYLASGRPILAGRTPDVCEVLRHADNAFLCRPDSLDALVGGLETLIADHEMRARLAANALADSRVLTWEARARRIASVLEDRLRSPACREKPSGRSPPWLRQSGRWLLHLMRSRSFVLPPDGLPSEQT